MMRAIIMSVADSSGQLLKHLQFIECDTSALLAERTHVSRLLCGDIIV